jgi:predicted PurR-regulated permease PerM
METKRAVQARPRLESLCLVFLSFAAGVFLLRYAQGVFLPVMLSLLIFYALDPLVNVIARIGIPRLVGCVFVMALLIGAGALAVYLLRGQAQDLIQRLPEALSRAKEAIESSRGGTPAAVAEVQQAAVELGETASEAAGNETPKGVTRVQVEEPLFKPTDYLWSGSINLMWLIGQAVTVLCLVFFLLASGELYKRKIVEGVGTRLSQRKITIEILNDIHHQIGQFLLVQLAISALIGTATGISLWLLGVNQAAMWGVTAGVFNAIPYFGSIIVTSALALVAFLQFGSLDMVWLVAGVTLVVTSADWIFLTPMLTGRISKMNNIAVFVSLIFWYWLWGALGMFLAVPIMMVLKSICDHIEELQPIGNLLSESAAGGKSK